MSATKNLHVFPITNRQILLLQDSQVENVVFLDMNKISIYSKALSSSIIQAITTQSQAQGNEKTKNILILSIDFARKVYFLLIDSQKVLPDAIRLLRLFLGIIAMLEELLKNDLEAEHTANCLYGIFEMLTELNSNEFAA